MIQGWQPQKLYRIWTTLFTVVLKLVWSDMFIYIHIYMYYVYIYIYYNYYSDSWNASISQIYPKKDLDQVATSNSNRVKSGVQTGNSKPGCNVGSTILTIPKLWFVKLVNTTTTGMNHHSFFQWLFLKKWGGGLVISPPHLTTVYPHLIVRYIPIVSW